MIINNTTKRKMLEHAYKNVETLADRNRKAVYGDSHYENVISIRNKTKSELLKYIAEQKRKPSVIFAYKIAHSSSPRQFRSLSDSVKQNVELINYAHNRLTHLST